MRQHLTRRQFLTGGVALSGVAVARFSAVLFHVLANQSSVAGPRTPEEQQFIAATERLRGRPLTDQEANFAVAQAQWFGDL